MYIHYIHDLGIASHHITYLQSWINLKRRPEVGCDAIVENGELPIRREEVQRSGGLELVQVYALVKVAVVQDNLTHDNRVISITLFVTYIRYVLNSKIECMYVCMYVCIHVCIRLYRSICATLSNNEVFIQRESEFRISREKAFHENAAIDGRVHLKQQIIVKSIYRFHRAIYHTHVCMY